MRVYLQTASGHAVGAGDIPPFQTPPDAVQWGSRTFILIDAQVRIYREAFVATICREVLDGVAAPAPDPGPQPELPLDKPPAA